MLKTSCFNLLLIVLTSPLFAQADPGKDILELDFGGYEIDLTDIPFLIDEVIDATGTGGASLGTAHKGIGNRQVDLKIKNGLELGLSSLFLRSANQREETLAKVRITALTLNEFVGATSESAKVELEAELAIPSKDGFLLYGPLRFVDVRSGIDVTDGHPRALIKALEKILRQFPEEVAATPGRTVSEPELRKAPNDYAVDKKDLKEIPDGFYQTFMDFRAGTVSHPVRPEVRKTRDPHIDENGKAYEIITLKRPQEVKAREFQEFWGAQIDGKPYLKIQDNYFEVWRDEQQQLMVALPRELFKSENGGTIAAASAMFGIIGGLVASAIVDGDYGEIAIYRFSSRDGKVIVSETNSADEVSGVILNSSDFSSKDNVLRIRNTAGMSKVVKPGEYILLGEVEEVCLSVDDGQETCEKISVNESSSTFYQITVKKNGRYRLTWMPDEAAEKVITQLKEGAVKAIK
ncbi:hypothetical protein [Neolewinella persica]|uniref:hypothetical protein n=1 Tax=Neolewinella persica TaxID=70998 RepID=UPI00036A18F3|nr:hypothetical protein [Neolewinella persica]